MHTAKAQSDGQKVIGVSRYPLDARFDVVRSSESNAGNLMADLARQTLGADVALMNAGGLRAHRMIGAGLISMNVRVCGGGLYCMGCVFVCIISVLQWVAVL